MSRLITFEGGEDDPLRLCCAQRLHGLTALLPNIHITFFKLLRHFCAERNNVFERPAPRGIAVNKKLHATRPRSLRIAIPQDNKSRLPFLINMIGAMKSGLAFIFGDADTAPGCRQPVLSNERCFAGDFALRQKLFQRLKVVLLRQPVG